MHYWKNIKGVGLHNCPTAVAVGKIVKKFEETGVIKSPVHHHFARSAENIEEANVSIPNRCQKLGLFYENYVVFCI